MSARLMGYEIGRRHRVFVPELHSPVNDTDWFLRYDIDHLYTVLPCWTAEPNYDSG